MEIIYSFFDEVCQIWCILQCFSEFNIFNKSGTHRAFYLIREFITIVEALSKCLYLIAIASKTDYVFCAIVLEIKHEFFSESSNVTPITIYYLVCKDTTNN